MGCSPLRFCCVTIARHVWIGSDHNACTWATKASMPNGHVRVRISQGTRKQVPASFAFSRCCYWEGWGGEYLRCINTSAHDAVNRIILTWISISSVLCHTCFGHRGMLRNNSVPCIWVQQVSMPIGYAAKYK